MKILILGGEGMLGHKMFQTLSRDFDDVYCTILGKLNEPFYSSIDLFQNDKIIEGTNAADLVDLREKLDTIKPDVAVNCIGIVKQREEAKAYIPSITLNALLPHVLAECLDAWNGKLIHFSTDCVFSGKKGDYTEEDPSDAEDLYGKTKYLGETTESNALTLRTSIIGRELANFKSLLEWFLSQNGKTVQGYKNVIYSGVTTNYLAKTVSNLIKDFPDLAGLYQVTAPKISKHDLLCRIRDAYGLNIEIIPNETEVCDRSMIGEKFRNVTGYPEPSWQSLIEELVSDSTPYEKWRA